MSYTAPKYGEKRFNCPNCTAFADQHWSPASFRNEAGGTEGIPFTMSRCASCKKFSVWYQEQMVHPRIVSAPLPNSDMPPDIKTDFDEAREISGLSSRGACALLRLCVEKLCIHLGETSGDLNAKIGNLVTKGLRPEIQQSLDAVRVIGNDAVHPGELNIKDDPKTANSLFALVNLIVQTMITDPKIAKEVYDKISQEKKDNIDNRDN